MCPCGPEEQYANAWGVPDRNRTLNYMLDVHASPFLSCAFECDYKNLKDKTGTAGYIGKSF